MRRPQWPDSHQLLSEVPGTIQYEAIPEIAEILRRHKISGREYMLTHLVAMVTAMADDTHLREIVMLVPLVPPSTS